mgnify:CR=1 FL=1
MTKKQAYKIIEKQYGKVDVDDYVSVLCTHCPEQLRYDWISYWNKINTRHYYTVLGGFREGTYEDIHASLVRLILLHHFIEDTYK